MGKFKALLQFEFKTNSSRFKDDSFFSRFKRGLLTLIGAGALIAVFVFAINVVMSVFIDANMQQEFITLFTFIMHILLVIVGVSMATKTLFTKVDLSIIKLPVGGIDVFIAKFIYLYVKCLFLSCLLSVPTFIMFGIKTLQGVMFYLLLVPNVLFLPVIPLLISLILAVPVMWLVNIFKNKFLILLAFYTLAIVAGFTLYIYVLKFVLNVFETGNFADVFDGTTVYALKQFTSYLYLSLLFKNVLLIYNFWKSALINLTLVVCLAALIYFYARTSYFSLLISSKNQS